MHKHKVERRTRKKILMIKEDPILKRQPYKCLPKNDDTAEDKLISLHVNNLLTVKKLIL